MHSAPKQHGLEVVGQDRPGTLPSQPLAAQAEVKIS